MTTQADQAAIAALTQKVVASWAYADAETFASVFVDDGTMILEGVFCQGKEAIRDRMAEEFAGRWKDTQVTGKPIGIRALGPDTALLISQGGVLAAGETEVSDDSAIHATWLAVRQEDGGWKLASYQNSPRFFKGSVERDARAA